MHRLLLDAVDRARLRDPGHVEDRRRDVDHVGELRAQDTGVGDALRPPDDHRIARAAEVRADLLAPLERGVPGPRPRRAVVGVHDLRSPLLHAPVSLGQLQLHLVRQRDAVLHRHLVEGTGDRALHAGAVVAPDPDDDGVVELAELLDRIDQATDVVVGVLGESCVYLHLPGVERLELVGYVVPRGERVVARRELGVGRDDPQLLLTREGLLAELVPPLVELPLVLLRPLLGDVMGRMTAPGGEVDEERLRRHPEPGRRATTRSRGRPSHRGSSTGSPRRRTPPVSRSSSGSRSGRGPIAPSLRPGTRRSSRTPNRSASGRTARQDPAGRPGSGATCRRRTCCSRCLEGSVVAAHNRAAGWRSTRGTRRRTRRRTRTRRNGCCGRSAAPPGSASRAR